MNSVEYLNAVTKTWDLIQARIDDSELDVDCFIIGSVFTIETSDKKQVIINRQEPKHELWLASTAGASHYRYDQDQQDWVNTQNGKSFWEYCDQALVAIDQPKLFTDLY